MMPTMRRCLVALALLLAACSGSDDEPEAREATTTSTTQVPGCDAPAPAEGQEKVTLTSGGVERWSHRQVPSGPGPWPVVVDLHGYSEGADIHAQLSALGPYGAEEGFVTLTPHGTGDPVRWDTSLTGPDISFLEDLLDETARTVCIDPDRVFFTGLSNGGMMTSVVACALADRVAAVAPVAGVRDPEGCEPPRPVPLLAIHGTADTFVTYDGGLGEGALNLPAPDGSGRTLGEVGAGQVVERDSVPEIMAAWAERYGCEPEPAESRLTEDVVRLEHDCPGDLELALLRVDGGGHSWPGSPFGPNIEEIVGKTTQTISANEQLWTFFQAHPLR